MKAKRKNCDSEISNKSNKSKVKKRVNENVQLENLHINKINKSEIKKKYKEKQYSCDAVQKALNAIDKGQSLRQAYRNFGVPKSTLHAKLKNYVPIDCVKGAPTFFTKDEENLIAEWIVYSAERGFPVTKNTLLDCVQKFIVSEKRENPFKDNRPGKHWYNGFMKRHNNLSIRIAQNLTSSRASVTEDELRKWFYSVEEYLRRKDLLNIDSERIFNLDESAFMLVPKDNTVITHKGAKSVYQIVSGNEKACITVLFTAAASGRMMPPMVLFDLKSAPKRNVLNDIPQGWGVGHSDRGWMTSETFYSYICNVFYKWLLDNNYEFPVILYVDGHSSHLTLPLMRFCKEFKIEIIALYPNATHIIQPLDVSLFHPLKEAYKKTLRTWRIENNVIDFKKSMFAKVLKLALDSTDFTDTIKNGFRACGLCPFNSDAVNYNILNKNKRKMNVSSSSSSNDNAKTTNSNYNIELLHVLEKSVIPPEILEEFKNNEFEELWCGDINQKGLFESWIKLKKLCGI